MAWLSTSVDRQCGHIHHFAIGFMSSGDNYYSGASRLTQQQDDRELERQRDERELERVARDDIPEANPRGEAVFIPSSGTRDEADGSWQHSAGDVVDTGVHLVKIGKVSAGTL